MPQPTYNLSNLFDVTSPGRQSMTGKPIPGLTPPPIQSPVNMPPVQIAPPPTLLNKVSPGGPGSNIHLQTALTGKPLSPFAQLGGAPPDSGDGLTGPDTSALNGSLPSDPFGSGLVGSNLLNGILNSGQMATARNDSGSGFLNSLTPQDYLGAAGLGLGAVGEFMNASTQKDQFNKNYGLEQGQLANQTQRLRDDESQLNPYKQQEDLVHNMLRQALLANGPAQAQFGTATPYDPGQQARADIAKQYLSPEALTAAKASFDQRNGAAPGAAGSGVSPDTLAQMQGQFGSDHQVFDNGFNHAGQKYGIPAGQQVNTTNGQLSALPKDDGGGFLHDLINIVTTAAPFVAAPFTGGLSLAAIGAGSGLAHSLNNGGDMGSALLNAGIGAIPGIGTGAGKAAGAVMPTLAQGASQLGKGILKNPTPLVRALTAK